MKTFLLKNLLRIETYLGIGAGYSGSNYFSGSTTGDLGKIPSLIINISNYQIHLHHWFLSFLFLIILIPILYKKYKINHSLMSFIFGVLTGTMMQGIFEYSDWYRIIKRN